MRPNLFPHFDANGGTETGEADRRYNCVAWAAGRADAWWWPDAGGDGFWPEGAPRAETVEAFVSAFALLGYAPCETAEHEPGWEKVALYAAPSGVPTHAARQLPDGTWTSKLGRGPVVTHNTPHGVEGPVYGAVCCFLKRPSPATS
jgi:hypothetical protein